MRPYFERDGMTIYCGDCRDVLPQLTDVADLIVTDPPYGVNYVSGFRQASFGPIAGDDGTLPVLDLLRLALHKLRRGRHIYCFGLKDFGDLPIGGECEIVWDKGILVREFGRAGAVQAPQTAGAGGRDRGLGGASRLPARGREPRGARCARRRRRGRFGGVDSEDSAEANLLRDLDSALDAFNAVDPKRQHIGRFTLDFGYYDKGLEQRILEDVKSRPTKTTAYMLRKKLLKALFDLEVVEVGG